MAKADADRIGVPAFYSLVGFILSVGLQSTCKFVERSLILNYTPHPTVAPTGVPTATSSNAPSLVPTVAPTGVPTATNSNAPSLILITAATTNVPTMPVNVTSPTITQTDPQVTQAPTGSNGADDGGGGVRGLQSDARDEVVDGIMDGILDQVDAPAANNTKAKTAEEAEGSTTMSPKPTLSPKEQREIVEKHSHGIGLWQWQIDGKCVPYSICTESTACVSPNFDSHFNAARTFSIFASLIGGVVTIVLLIAIWFPFHVVYLTPVFVVLMLFNGLSLLVHQSDMCDQVTNWDFFFRVPNYYINQGIYNLDDENVTSFEQDVKDQTTVACGQSAGAKMAIAAIVMWFLAAITCFWNKKKTRDV